MPEWARRLAIKRFIEGLTSDGKHEIHWDTELKGFKIRVARHEDT
jgi:hypothetical protein